MSKISDTGKERQKIQEKAEAVLGKGAAQVTSKSSMQKEVGIEVESVAEAPKKSHFWSETYGQYIVQKVLFHTNASHMAPDAYYTRLDGLVSRKGTRLTAPAESKIGFNNYINSFYASYWEEYTSLREFSLSGMINGRANLVLFQSADTGKLVKIGTFPIGHSDEDTKFNVNFSIDQYMPTDGGAGRFFFDIEAVDDIELVEVAFCCWLPPEADKSFSIGICTFRKEKYITNILHNLRRYLTSGDTPIKDVFIVNNDKGAESLSGIRKIISETPGMTLLEQHNIGGAGGFTRSLHESITNSDSDYHIFIDDDVYIDVNVFERVAAFISYMDKDHIVGGQMLNMMQPEMLYEGGGKLTYWAFLEKVGENINGTSGAEVNFFDQKKSVDYNAWWFAAVPKSKVDQIGYPLNVFIRGDDFEYGLRYKNMASVGTVSLPGVFIWHEPFEGKTSAWLEYYNWRNRFAICAIHGDGVTMEIQQVDLLRDVLCDHLGADRFPLVFAVARAIIDFMSGPQAVLGSDPETLHKALQKDFADLAEHPDIAGTTKVLQAAFDQLDEKKLPATPIRLRHSPALGGTERSRKVIKWIDTPLEEMIDQILARYAATLEDTKTLWRTGYTAYTSPQAWEKIFKG